MNNNSTYNADIAVLAAVAAYKWYLWKNKIIAELPKDSPNFMAFPACNWDVLFREVLKAHRPDLFAEIMLMPSGERLEYVYSKVSPIKVPSK